MASLVLPAIFMVGLLLAGFVHVDADCLHYGNCELTRLRSSLFALTCPSFANPDLDSCLHAKSRHYEYWKFKSEVSGFAD